MRHGKAPTRRQKIMLSNYRLNPKNWLVLKDCGECFEIVHRVTGTVRRLNRKKSIKLLELKLCINVDNYVEN